MSTREELLVPIAYTSAGELVRPDGAERGGLYSCPGCGGAVGLRGGPGTRWRVHFFHHGDGSGCNPETVLHRAAKRAIREGVERWVAGSGPAPEAERECPVPSCRARHYVALRARVSAALEEVRLPSGRVADVALLRQETPVATVEIRVTHAVDDAKRGDMASDGIPSIELDAVAALANPLRWRGLQGPNQKRRCPSCDGEEQALARASAPPWVRAMRLSEPEEEVEREVLRKGRRVVLQARRRPAPGGLAPEELFYRREVAELRAEITHDRWLRGLVGWRRVAATGRGKEGVPPYAEGWLVVQQALKAHSGRWLPRLEEQWQGRFDVTDADERRARRIDIRRIAAETGQDVPGQGSMYWAEPYRCYSKSCRAEMLVYSWKGRAWMATELPQGEPPPATLQWFRSKTAGEAYWANCCPGCGAPQGENFVSQPIGPLRRGRRRFYGDEPSAVGLFHRYVAG